MSQPKRYGTTEHEWLGDIFTEKSDGEYVLYSDYAALAAENERLRSKLSFSQSISEICKQAQEGETITVQGSISSGKTVLTDLCQCERLLAENERLRKAGDAMYGILAGAYFGWISGDAKAFDELPHISAWNAAKEGSDAK